MRTSSRFAVLVALTLTACDMFGPSHGPPANLTKSAGDDGEGIAGEVLTPAPAVRVTDAEGRAVPGAQVTFVVTDGEGTISAPQSATNGDGVAVAAPWTLGTTAGANALTASIASLAQVEFTATGIAGPPDEVAKASDDGAESHVGTPVAPRPTVRVTDEHGNLVAGLAVDFAVATGGGTVTGAAQLTNENGEATVGGWVLGSTPGANTLTATAGSLPAVTFTMTGADMCARSPDHAVGSATNATLTTGDCPLLSGHNADKYFVIRNGIAAFRLDQTSTEIDSRLMLLSSPEVALTSAQASTMNAAMRIIAGTGSVQIAASSTATAVNGAYSLTSLAIPESATDCVTTLLVSEPSTSQSVQDTDCFDSGSGGFYFDAFIFFTQPGRTYTVSMTSGAVDPYFELQTLSGLPTHSAFATGSGTLTADLSFTSSTSTHRVLLASTVNGGQLGSYTLSISSTASGASAGENPAPLVVSRFTPGHPQIRGLLDAVTQDRLPHRR